MSANRTFRSFPVKNSELFKMQMLNWINRFSICCLLDNHCYPSAYTTQECLAAAGAVQTIAAKSGRALQELRHFIQQQKDWLFGHLAYDLKNEIEPLHSNHPDYIGFEDLLFFVPQYVFLLNDQEVSIGSLENDHEVVFNQIHQQAVEQAQTIDKKTIQHRFTKEEYLHSVNRLKAHIQRGDCYEINFCQEFYASPCCINPLTVFTNLCAVSPNPFSCFYKSTDKYLLCASPERFIKREGQKIYSQPIKGTIARTPADRAMDERNKQWLYHSPKDKAENVMVVDLVRNDLSRICKEGTVKVEELFGVYSYPQVHQMISTISGELKENCNFIDIIQALFPMGSMTGAPKRKVMELIEQYEKTKRGLFSGSVGYIEPGGNFDFNVVIRSLFYNEINHYLSYQTGSGITFYADPEKEYEECLLKAKAIEKVLGN